MTLRDALDDSRRDHGVTTFPGERRTTDGLFSGRDGRLVHVAGDGALRDFGYPLTGHEGLARSRFGLRQGDAVTWFDDCETTDQRYHDDTALVVTEHDLSAGGDDRSDSAVDSVTQYDLTVGDAHLTQFEIDDSASEVGSSGAAAPDEPTIVAALGFAPEGRDDRVGTVHHGDAVEVYHDDEHDFVASATGFAEIAGQAPPDFDDLLGDEPTPFPADGPAGQYEETRLGGDVVCELPVDADSGSGDGDGAGTGTGNGTDTGTATLLTLLTDQTETPREEALDRLPDLLGEHDGLAALQSGAESRAPVARAGAPSDGLPFADAASADLRVLDLLSAPSGLRIAGPDFDPFYSQSGGYGYTWFRDDAEIAGFLLTADDQLDLGLDDRHAAAAAAYCDAQLADGTWPHRVWPRDASLAPGWANARLEAGDDAEYQADQTASAAAFLARFLDEVDTAHPDLRERVAAALDGALDGLDDTLAADGRPATCQNAWENMTGRFTHTAATFLDAYAAIGALDGDGVPAPLDAERVAHAADRADEVFEALTDVWVPERGIFALGEDVVGGESGLDDRCDSATFALASAHRTYAEIGEVDTERVERLESHVRTLADELHRETNAIEGLTRFEGDDWRTNGQDAEKVWTVSTAWGAQAATSIAALRADRGEDPAAFERLARELLGYVRPGGALCTNGEFLPEQFFDDGTPDSATPLGWPHALRLATLATMDRYHMLDATTVSD